MLNKTVTEKIAIITNFFQRLTIKRSGETEMFHIVDCCYCSFGGNSENFEKLFQKDLSVLQHLLLLISV